MSLAAFSCVSKERVVYIFTFAFLVYTFHDCFIGNIPAEVRTVKFYLICGFIGPCLCLCDCLSQGGYAQYSSSVSNNISIFSGSAGENGDIVTNGGRVLGVCTSESTLAETMGKIYEAISHIYFEAAHYRHDIGAAREEE